MLIRDELDDDHEAIRHLVAAAFAQAPHSSGTEPAIIDCLRAGNALSISLVATEGFDIIGHVAVSPVKVARGSGSWFGLGPVSVHPSWQRRGVGRTMVEVALERLRITGAAGCVVVGEPAYYNRFGFQHDPAATFANVPPPYFQVLPFGEERPAGIIEYHSAFN